MRFVCIISHTESIGLKFIQILTDFCGSKFISNNESHVLLSLKQNKQNDIDEFKKNRNRKENFLVHLKIQ